MGREGEGLLAWFWFTDAEWSAGSDLSHHPSLLMSHSLTPTNFLRRKKRGPAKGAKKRAQNSKAEPNIGTTPTASAATVSAAAAVAAAAAAASPAPASECARVVANAGEMCETGADSTFHTRPPQPPFVVMQSFVHHDCE